MIGNWSDKYGRKPFMVMGFATASLPLLVILLNLQFGVSMLFYFPAQVRPGTKGCHNMQSGFCFVSCLRDASILQTFECSAALTERCEKLNCTVCQSLSVDW